jgi:hypothetical protein
MMGKTRQQTTTTTTTHADRSPLDATLEATARHKSVLMDAASILGVNPTKLCDLLRNVWKTSKGVAPLTDAEMFKGLSLIARYELDPIAKDVYVTRTKDGKLLTIIGIDGWIKVLDRTEHYDGFEWDDETDANGKVIAVNVRIYSTKRSRPTTYRGLMSEYQRVGGVVAKDMPVHMLRLFSLRHAARLFTPIGGDVLTEEEARYVQDHHAEQSVVPSSKSKSEALADHLMNRMAEPTPEPEQEPEPEQQAETADGETAEDNAAISWCEAIIARLMKASNVLQFSQIRDQVYAHPFRDELPQEALDRLSAALMDAEKRCSG